MSFEVFTRMPMLMLIQVGIPCKWTDDSKLLFGYFDMIRNSPSQIYHYVLQLPPSSWLRKCYSGVKVIEGELAEWGTDSHSVSSGKHTQALIL